MSASLVGSEMCIRDRACRGPCLSSSPKNAVGGLACVPSKWASTTETFSCLLYTSDAADDM
eukprot:15101517-Alexandrium_andersonii.AAC.1